MKRKQLIVFQMEFDGTPRKDIAASTGISENTLNIYLAKQGKWRSSFDAWKQELVGDIEKQSRMRLKKHINEAVDVLLVSLTRVNSQPAIALRAAQDILDRAGLKAPEHTEPDSEDMAERIFRAYEARFK